MLFKGVVVSKTTIKLCFADEFKLKAYKSAKIPKLTLSNKNKTYAFAKAHLDWPTENWRKVLFSHKLTEQKITGRKQPLKRPVGARYEERYTIQTLKHPPSIMVCGAMSAHGTAGLYFLQPDTTINGAKYLNLLKDKLKINKMVHGCNVFMHDVAPCHRAKSVKNFLQEKNVDVLDGQETVQT